MQQKKILLMGHADGLGGSQTAFRQLYQFVQDEGHIVKVIALTDQRKKTLPFQRSTLLGRIAHQKSVLPLSVQKLAGVVQAGVRARQFQPHIFIGVGLNNSANSISRFLGPNCFKIGQDFIADRLETDPIWHSSRAMMNGVCVQAPSMLQQWRSANHGAAGLNWLPCFPEPPVAGILRAPRRLDADQPVRLAYFGRLAGNKGLPLLVRAIADHQLADTVALDLWSTGQEEDALRKLATELGLQERVRFRGKYPSHEAGAKLMAGYDALALCSTACEGLPLILLEAMAYGLPFLATDVGAIQDCCRDNADALLVQPTQAAITKGLITLVGKVQANEFDASRHRRFYDKTFSQRVMGARWRECLQNPELFFYAS